MVPRSHARDDPLQRLCGAGRVLPLARRARRRRAGTLPGPAPALGDPPGLDYFEIPIAIQDRSFTEKGALFYPDNRAFFEGLEPSQLQIPFMPDAGCDGPSDIAPIWNPEFFGNAIVVNGRTWPSLDVQQRRYRLRFLNGCNSRFLILRMSNGLPFWQIGNEGGFLPAPVELPELLLGPAERADVIVDFTNVALGHRDHPREHRSGRAVRRRGRRHRLRAGRPGYDRAGDALPRRPRDECDISTPPSRLVLPAIAPLGAATNTRQVSLNEQESATCGLVPSANGIVVLDCAHGEPFGPVEADLGTLNPDGSGNPLGWDEPITENPAVGPSKSGRSTTSPRTPTRSTSTRSRSRSLAAR